MKAAAPMNDGKTSGSGARTRHNGANGRSVRVSSHAKRHSERDGCGGHQHGELDRPPRGRQRFEDDLAAIAAEGERPPGDVQYRGSKGDGDGDPDDVQHDEWPASRR